MSRKKTKPLRGQLIFEFSLRRQILRKLKTMNDRVKHLLRVLDDHAGDSTDCWMHVETIAREMCMAKRTAEKTIREAETEGWLIRFRPGRFWRCDQCRGWNRQRDRAAVCGHCESDRAANAQSSYRNCTTYRLCRAAMKHLAGIPDDDDDVEKPADRCAPGADANRTTCATDPHDVRMRSAPGAHPKKPPPKPLSKPSPKPSNLFDPPNPRAGRTGGDPSETAWRGLVDALIDYGCRSQKSIDSAVAQCRRAGNTPDAAAAVIAHAAAHELDGVRAWGPGAVLGRIATLRPGDDPAADWPPADDEYRRRERQRRDRDQRTRERRVEEIRRLPADELRKIADSARAQGRDDLADECEKLRWQPDTWLAGELLAVMGG